MKSSRRSVRLDSAVSADATAAGDAPPLREVRGERADLLGERAQRLVVDLGLELPHVLAAHRRAPLALEDRGALLLAAQLDAQAVAPLLQQRRAVVVRGVVVVPPQLVDRRDAVHEVVEALDARVLRARPVYPLLDRLAARRGVGPRRATFTRA